MEVTHLSIATPRWQIYVIRSITYVTFLALSFRIFYHILNGTDGYLTVPVDDFYYYFTVGKNIAASLGSTFDGITFTNGYHPLWLICITGLHCVFTEITWFFGAVALISLVSSVITFELAYRLLFKTLTPNSASYSILLFLSLSYGWMATWSMEVTIAIPLYVYSFIKFSEYLNPIDKHPSYYFRFGLLLSALTLSRVDLLAFCGVLLCIFLVARLGKSSFALMQLMYIVLGCFPIALYFLVNVLYFDSLLPLSGTAKQLTKYAGFNNHLLWDLRSLREGYIATIIIPLAIASIGIFRNKLRGVQNHVVLYLGLTYPILYFIIYGVQSDWIIFVWYQFMLPVAIGFGIYCIYESIKEYIKVLPGQLVSVTLCLGVLAVMLPKLYQTCYSQTIEWSPYPGSIYDHAKKLSAFTSLHPGLYAMGDRAGLTQYIIQRPVVQLEGLMSDKKFLSNIAEQKNLLSVLTSLDVDYVIVSTFTKLRRTKEGYFIEIPFVEQAGHRSKKMSAYLLQEPVFHISNTDKELAANQQPPPPMFTYIFALHR